MVAEVLQYIGDNVKIRQAEADAMYAGIVIDTNNFMNKTGVRTFEAAAFLRQERRRCYPGPQDVPRQHAGL